MLSRNDITLELLQPFTPSKFIKENDFVGFCIGNMAFCYKDQFLNNFKNKDQFIMYLHNKINCSILT